MDYRGEGCGGISSCAGRSWLREKWVVVVLGDIEGCVAMWCMWLWREGDQKRNPWLCGQDSLPMVEELSGVKDMGKWPLVMGWRAAEEGGPSWVGWSWKVQ